MTSEEIKTEAALLAEMAVEADPKDLASDEAVWNCAAMLAEIAYQLARRNESAGLVV
jgi:hypothetical protein